MVILWFCIIAGFTLNAFFVCVENEIKLNICFVSIYIGNEFYTIGQ